MDHVLSGGEAVSRRIVERRQSKGQYGACRCAGERRRRDEFRCRGRRRIVERTGLPARDAISGLDRGGIGKEGIEKAMLLALELGRFWRYDVSLIGCGVVEILRGRQFDRILE